MTLDPNQPLHPGPLQSLSLTRGVSHVLSNAERMAILRPFLPVEFGNSTFTFDDYARQETLDGAYPTTGD